MAKGNILTDNIIIFILLAVFLIGMLALVDAQRNGADVWESYYVGELTKVINSGSVGDEIVLDVTKAIEVADRNRIDSNRIFDVDFESRNVCVRLSNNRKSCLNYFNEVRVVEMSFKPGEEGTLLAFSLVEVRDVE